MRTFQNTKRCPVWLRTFVEGEFQLLHTLFSFNYTHLKPQNIWMNKRTHRHKYWNVRSQSEWVAPERHPEHFGSSVTCSWVPRQRSQCILASSCWQRSSLQTEQPPTIGNNSSVLLVQCHSAAWGEWKNSPYLLEHSQLQEVFFTLCEWARRISSCMAREKWLFHKSLCKSANGAFFLNLSAVLIFHLLPSITEVCGPLGWEWLFWYFLCRRLIHGH